jgi:hypothetical protein
VLTSGASTADLMGEEDQALEQFVPGSSLMGHLIVEQKSCGRQRRATYTVNGIKACGTMKKARGWTDEHGMEYAFHDDKVAGIDRRSSGNEAGPSLVCPGAFRAEAG